MAHIIAESTFEFPFSEDEAKQGAQDVDLGLGKSGSFCLRSYYSQDRRRMICEFEAPDPESVKEAYSNAGVPLDRVWQAEILSGATASAD